MSESCGTCRFYKDARPLRRSGGGEIGSLGKCHYDAPTAGKDRWPPVQNTEWCRRYHYEPPTEPIRYERPPDVQPPAPPPGFDAGYDELNRRREAIDWDALRIKQQRDALARAVLMFHSSSPWTAEKRFEWQALAGTEEVPKVSSGDAAAEPAEASAVQSSHD